MKCLLDGFYRCLLYLAALFMIATLLTILLSVGGRQFGFDVPGLDAYAGYSIAAVLFLALPATLRNGDHIRVTLLISKLKGNARKLTDYWCLTAASGMSMYLAYYSLRLIWISYTTHDISSGSDATPLWIPQVAMAVGSAGLAIAFIEDLVRKLLNQERVTTPGAEISRVE